MGALTAAGQVVSEAVREFPTCSHSSLARTLYAQCPTLWTSADACYQMVRAYRGRHGTRERRRPTAVAVQDAWHSPEQCAERRADPFRCPPSSAPPWEPYDLHAQSVLVLGDVHVPYHDAQALEAAVAWGQRREVDCVLLLGDFLDCHRLSRFQADPRARLFPAEVETARELLAALHSAFPRAGVVYKLGNHDERYEAYILARAPELWKVDKISFASLFAESDVELVEWRRRIRAGKHLSLIHGHEFGSRGATSPVNPARGLFLAAHACAICAHLHQPSTHQERTIDGAQLATWSVGCLCDLHPQYRPLNRWGHGFAHVALDGDGWFEVENHRIIEGRVV